MTICARFAPSPTGRLHVGNARTALINWLFVRANDGEFLLRLDDTDKVRSTDEYAQGIEQDMLWLGLKWDRFAKQSERMDRYDKALIYLKDIGRVYPCYETADELSLQRKTLLSQGRPPIYNRAALKLSDKDRAKFEAEGRKPHWRFLMNDDVIEWRDLVRGDVKFEGAHTSDPVLIRSDGVPLYTLPSIVDDEELDVTHVIRGEDHVTNTAVQMQIIKALDYSTPTYAHMPLIADQAGDGLSKRLGSLSLAVLREDGFEPMAIASLMGKIGTSDAIKISQSMEELTKEFDFAKFGRATAKFSMDELARLNSELIHHYEYDDVLPHLKELTHLDIPRDFWYAVRENLKSLREIIEWWVVCYGTLEVVNEDKDFVEAAADCLPDSPWTEETWSVWVKAVKETTGRKGKNLFMPLRLALTGKDHGPELKYLLPLMGRERVLTRLTG
jgi:glutamyl-tRNA synthetase